LGDELFAVRGDAVVSANGGADRHHFHEATAYLINKDFDSNHTFCFECFCLILDTGKQKARLEELLATLQGGDVRRGQAVFKSTKAACSACHAIGYMGGNVGPDLTHIAKIRTERDLLESIVFPSASIVRSYEPVAIATKDGKVYNGLVRRESPDEIVLATAANQEARIARDDIEYMRPSNISVMPAGLDQQLTRAIWATWWRF
jgi:putative heme-binding domain-containing protein